MKDCKYFLEEILKYPTEGEEDDITIEDMLNPDNTFSNDGGETEEEKAARIKAAEEAGSGGDNEEEEEEDNEEGEDEDNLALLQSMISGENLSDDEKELRQEILNKFKGDSIDADGNILDKEGNIIAEFNKVDKFLNDEPTLDDKGNQVDESGKIIKTKAQLDFEKSAIGGVVAELSNDYELLDEEGNPKMYDDTLEGYTKLAKDIAEIEAQNQYQSLLESNPVLTEVAKHLLSGGKLEDFNNPIDYKSIDVKKLSQADKLDIIKRSYITSGMNESSANDMMEFIKEKGDAEIDKRLTPAIDTLQTHQDNTAKERDKKYQESVKAQEDRIIQYWNGVKKTIDNGKLGSIELPKGDKEKFFKYISTPVDKEGNSQETLDNREEGLESDLLMRYYRWKKYNVSDIVRKDLNKNKVNTLRERIQKAKQNKSTSSNARRSNQTSDDDISLDTLI